MANDQIAKIDERLARLEAALTWRIPPVFDPPPDDFGRFGGFLPRFPIPLPNPGDPVPIDISRLSKAQLEVSLENLKAQRIRLDAMETMIKQQMKQLG
jgi:hypothetical protein